ncbi:MAG: PQQ-binding-like beta-propeller repeat protein [Kiritimatiellia bacterium]
MATPKSNNAELDLWRRMARGVGVVALVFCLVVGVLLTLDWLRAGQAQTVCSEALYTVMAQARQSPDNHTVTLAREMDLVARHAYFSSVEFRRTGIWMLVAGLLVMAGCLHLAARLGRKIDDPRRFPAADPVRADRQARLALLGTGVVGLLLLALWATICSSPATPRIGLPPAPVTAPGATGTSAGDAALVPRPPELATSDALPELPWSCFRGPRYGVSLWTNLPVAWDGKRGDGVRWKVALNKPGVSSPVLWGGKLFLTVADEQARAVVAYDAHTGKELWRQVVADGGTGEDLPKTTDDTGLGASTPACDENGVYAVFGTGDLVAFTHDGKRMWQVYLRRPNNSYGHASSLWVQESKVYVQYDQADGGRMLAIDARSGSTVWEQPRIKEPVWCSPMVVASVDGKPLLLALGRDTVDAYDAAAGNACWSVEGVSGEVSPSPAYWSGRVLVANAGARMVCYELTAKPVKKWEYKDELPDVASPVAAGGLVFLASSSGPLVCLDATEGRELWKHEYATGFYASPIVAGNRVYALDRDGVMRIVALERTFREIASCPLGEAADATPAFADGRIYIRSKHTLWCLGTK